MISDKILKEVKAKFPIGCKYKLINCNNINTLKLDDNTYKAWSDGIFAHSGGGNLYRYGQFATLVEEPIISNPQYEIY